MAGDWLYHYTSRTALAAIRRDGIIRASPARLYRTLDMTDEPRLSAPLVWLTINPLIEMTVIAKLHAMGLPITGNLVRLVLPLDYTDLSLPEWCDQTGRDPEAWRWIVWTGQYVGSHYTTWRVVPHDIPTTAVDRVQRLGDGSTPDDVRWIEDTQ
jgi:hypothetical protein